MNAPKLSRALFRRIIKEALDREDIEGLLALGAPADEYDDEASLIEAAIANLTDFGERRPQVGQIENTLSELWNRQFGPFSAEELDRRRGAFVSIARNIVASIP